MKKKNETNDMSLSGFFNKVIYWQCLDHPKLKFFNYRKFVSHMKDNHDKVEAFVCGDCGGGHPTLMGCKKKASGVKDKVVETGYFDGGVVIWPEKGL